MGSQPVKVLIVDDQVPICQMIEKALAERQFDCAWVGSGEAAEQCLLAEDFDVVVLDLLLPGISGIDVLKFILQHRLSARVICMAGDYSGHWRHAAAEGGAYHFFEKPFDVFQLAEAVSRAAEEGRDLTCVPGAARQPIRPDDVARQADQPSPDALSSLSATSPKGRVRAFPSLATFRQPLGSVHPSRRQRTPCAAMAIGLDGAAGLRLAHGQDCADWVLGQLAGRIRGCLGQGAFLARGSADEFVVLLPEFSEGQAVDLGRKTRRGVNAGVLTYKGRALAVSVSVGLAAAEDGFVLDGSELVHRARAAMQAARAAGGNRVISYADVTGGRAPLDKRYLRQVLLESSGALVRAVEAKDPYTSQHSVHVAFYAKQLGRHVGLAEEDLENIRIAGLLHDIGKIAVPDKILTKVGKLTDQEFAFIRRHPDVGAAILENISMLQTEARVVRFHHENWDGSGYPTGLAGEAIPLGSRIINLADSIDAMLMHRTYKSAYSVEKMLQELHDCAGRQFDPSLAAATVDWCRRERAQIILPPGTSQVGTA